MDPFLGEIKLFAGTFAPVGWNYCDGTLLSISTNDALYALLGTTYGGDGVNTFAVPDLRGRVPIHQGSQTGLPTYVIGQVGGVTSVTLLASNMPAHSHTLSATAELGKDADPRGKLLGAADDTCLIYKESATATVPLSPAHVGPSGGSQPHDNMQPYLAMNYIIATSGIYPSQS